VNVIVFYSARLIEKLKSADDEQMNSVLEFFVEALLSANKNT